MSIYKIIRKQGPFKHRHGISIENLKRYHKSILYDHDLIADDLKKDDQFVSVLFKIADMEHSLKYKDKFFLNPYNNKITLYEDVIEQSQQLEWSCAICQVNMPAKMSDFSINNFVCKNCKDSHNSNNTRIDPRIVDSSFEFHQLCRKKLLKEQRKFLKYIKYFETGYKRGRL